MRIQHNIPAMSAYRNYTANVSALAKNLEKLSSGYKINRAGDDAAGLAISEKMRAQISGLEQAQNNAKDGISLIQTAEGALTEVHDMLNRMYTLAEQSANGTYDNDVDRTQLQKEVDQLRTEINRIADSSNFNGIKLLDGSMSGGAYVANYNDVGLTAVLDATPEKTPNTGKYELDLSNAKWSLKDTTSAATLSFTFGDLQIKAEITASKSNEVESVTGEEIMAAIANALQKSSGVTGTAAGNVKVTLSSGGTDVKFNGKNEIAIQDKKFTANVDGGVLTLEGKDYAEFTQDPQTMEFKMATHNNIVENAQESTANGNQGWSQAWSMIEEPVGAAGTLYGQAKFELGSDVSISDGTTIKIGDETYTFALGKNSKFANANNVVDLTDMETVDNKKAAARLSGVANGNKGVYVEHDSATGTVYLTEKKDGINRNEYDLYGEPYIKGTSTAGVEDQDATWRSKTRSYVQFGQASRSDSHLILQIGDTADSFNQLKVAISDCHAVAMGIGSIDISTQAGASSALTAVKNAINYVSDVRGTLGATQNRLDHTINNLSVMQENIQDAESTIRDVDVAKEMMSYTKNSILVQSAQAMLAQANQLPQGVLQLLQ